MATTSTVGVPGNPLLAAASLLLLCASVSVAQTPAPSRAPRPVQSPARQPQAQPQPLQAQAPVAPSQPPAPARFEIRRYVASGEPLDKAGAYAIQGAGAVLVERVRGSVSGVIGLPLHTVMRLAQSLGVSLLA